MNPNKNLKLRIIPKATIFSPDRSPSMTHLSKTHRQQLKLAAAQTGFLLQEQNAHQKVTTNAKNATPGMTLE